jgi:hypothetical protein
MCLQDRPPRLGGLTSEIQVNFELQAIRAHQESTETKRKIDIDNHSFFPIFDSFSPIGVQTPFKILLPPPFIEAHPRARALGLHETQRKIAIPSPFPPSLPFRRPPEIPNRQPNGSQPRAARLRNAVALTANTNFFVPPITFETSPDDEINTYTILDHQRPSDTSQTFKPRLFL